MEAAIFAIREGKGRYTAASGLPEVRRAVRDRFERDGYVFPQEQVMVTAGAKAALYMALFALCNEGDEVLYPSPFWGSYSELARAVGAKPVAVATLPEGDFQPDPAKIASAVTPRSRVLLLNSPNNPTGTVYSKDTLLGVADVVRRHDLFVLSDDIYDCLVYTKEPFLNILHVAPDLKDRVIVINSLSKSHSMTGWRFGMVGGPRAVIDAMARVQSQISGNPPTISQIAALTALSGKADPARAASLDHRRKILVDALSRIPGLFCPVPRGAFYAFPSIKSFLGKSHHGQRLATSTDLSKHLLEDQLVATVPGDAFGAPDHIRFTYTTPEAQITEGVRRFAAFLSELR
jgi:aspartate aminotransferase